VEKESIAKEEQFQDFYKNELTQPLMQGFFFASMKPHSLGYSLLQRSNSKQLESHQARLAHDIA
jgi:hypothetical protein